MNTDRQTSDSQPIVNRIARLFYTDHCNTEQIARAIGWHEAAVDRVIAQIMDAKWMMLSRGEPKPLTRPMERQAMPFLPGQRIRVSDDLGGLYIYRRFPARIGTIAGLTRYPNGDCIRVLWDGNKTATTIHSSMIEVVPAEQSSGEARG